MTRLRIDHAKKLLLAGNHSVTDICFDAGYESLGSSAPAFIATAFRQRLSGAKPGASSEPPAGIGRCTTCRLLSAFLRRIN